MRQDAERPGRPADNKNRGKKTWIRYLTLFAVIAAAAALLEVFLFNYRHFESLTFDPVTPAEAAYDYELVRNPQDPHTYSVLNPQNGVCSITFSGFDGDVQNIRLAVASSVESFVKYRIAYTDSGNELPYSPEMEYRVVYSVPRSQYIRAHMSGAESIRFDLKLYGNTTLYIGEISFNAVVPFFFSAPRALLVFALFSLLWLLRPRSAVYRLRLFGREKKRLKIAVCCLLILLQVLLFRYLTTLNPLWVMAPRNYDMQYHRVAEAFMKGQLHLEQPPPDWLQEMENPYDLNKRLSLEIALDDYVLWDHVYYEGHYYSYFGVLPVLIYYLPVALITGERAPTYFGIFLTLAAFAVLGMLLLYEVAKRWFRTLPFTVFLMLSLLFTCASGAIYIARRPDFYSFPIILSIALSVGGLYFWLSAKKRRRLICWRLAIGSLMIALNVISRPQFLLVAFFALPLFWDDVFKRRLLLSKNSIRQTALLLLPFIVVGAAAMWYNAARFSSVFDFGANYNLTSNDMRTRGLVLHRSWLGFFAYLFQPPLVYNYFPYLQPTWLLTPYLGVTVNEPTFGGVFACNAFALLSLLVFRARRLFREKIMVRRLAVTSFLFAMIIIFLDTQMAGVLPRYMADFSWLLLLISVFSSMQLFERLDRPEAHYALRLCFAAVFFCTLCYQFFLCYTDISFTLQDFSPEQYYRIETLFNFLT